MIRPATHGDMTDIVGIVLAANKQMGIAGRFQAKVNLPRIVLILGTMIHNPLADLSVVELNGTIAGACMVHAGGLIWDDTSLIATEHLWHMNPDWPNEHQKRFWFIKMLDHMIGWARAQGIKRFSISTPPETPAARLLTRRGFIHHETVFVGDM